MLNNISLKQVKIKDDFWTSKLNLYQDVTLIDSFEKFENDRGGAINNFDRVASGKSGNHAGPPWYDGLIYEMIRGAADFLHHKPDPELENRLDGYIERIKKAANYSGDGYLNTWTQLMEPDHRFGFNGGFLRWQHDVYNIGAMVEAAVHYWDATKKTKLLGVAVNAANYTYDTIFSERLAIVPSHSGPEEAFVKLYKLFKEHPGLKKDLQLDIDENKYFQLVEYWIENRSNHANGPDWENDNDEKCIEWIRNKEYGQNNRPSWGSYAQDHEPTLEQETIEGHAVRATLLFTGVVKAYRENNNPKYEKAVKRIWDNMVMKRMHISGGVGAIHQDEKFGEDYYLPNNAYLETCSAIGACFFHQLMSITFKDSKYADEVERVLYNNILNGVALNGKKYFYENPLEGKCVNRWDWHLCPCCPPMFFKILSELPSYIYSYDDYNLFVNQYIGSSADILLSNNWVKISQVSEMPWEGNVSITVTPVSQTRFNLKLRVPGYVRGIENPGDLYASKNNSSDDFDILLNGRKIDGEIVDGYFNINHFWTPGDKVQIRFPLPIRTIQSHSSVEENKEKVSFMRGPILYCFESIDNQKLDHEILKPGSEPTLSSKIDGLDIAPTISVESNTGYLRGIPFYLQNNRNDDQSIRVWMPTTVDANNEIPTRERPREISSSEENFTAGECATS